VRTLPSAMQRLLRESSGSRTTCIHQHGTKIDEAPLHTGCTSIMLGPVLLHFVKSRLLIICLIHDHFELSSASPHQIQYRGIFQGNASLFHEFPAPDLNVSTPVQPPRRRLPKMVLKPSIGMLSVSFHKVTARIMCSKIPLSNGLWHMCHLSYKQNRC